MNIAFINSSNATSLYFLLIFGILVLIRLFNPVVFSSLTCFWRFESYGPFNYQSHFKKLSLISFLLFLFRGLVFSAAFFLVIHQYKPKLNFKIELILAAWSTYWLLRYTLEYVLFFYFKKLNVFHQILSYRLSLRGKISLMLFLFLFITYYLPFSKFIFITIVLGLNLILFLFGYFSVIRRNETLWRNNKFYFILYICTFEIAPIWIITLGII